MLAEHLGSLPATVKRKKILRFGHITCHDTLQGILEGGGCPGRQEKLDRKHQRLDQEKLASTVAGGPKPTEVEEVVYCSISRVPPRPIAQWQ